MRYHWLGGSRRPYLERVKARRLERVAEMRRARLKATMSALQQITEKGFVFTNSLKAFAEAIGYLKDNQIPYEYIDGGKHWTYAIRRLDMKNGEDLYD